MDQYHNLLIRQKEFFQTGITKEYDFRIQALNKIRTGILNYEQEILKSLKKDLNKSEYEAYITEIGFVLSEIRFVIKNLKSWMRAKKVKTPWTHIGTYSFIYPCPYGCALIMIPWNYPFQLSFAPLIGAIAAGNCVVLKPSEYAPATAEVVQHIISESFPEEYVAVVQGDIETSRALLKENFDKIFFTGSVNVGKIVMEAAAKNLIPMTLELGGKSPCIVHKDAKIKLAAKRIAWGKLMNAGQTCIAPDYVYVHHDVKEFFIHELKNAISELYGENPMDHPDYTYIINKRHFDRLTGFLDRGVIAIGGKCNDEQRVIEPTVITDVTWNDLVMQDEIFGPILPVLEYEEISDVIKGVQNHPNPLALYLFTENPDLQRKIVKNISFGGGCINDTIYHLSTPYLPFGGVGQSGMGSYRGKKSFDAFSHEKSIMKQTTLFDLSIRYRRDKKGLKWIRRLQR